MRRIDSHAHIVVPEITANYGSEPWRFEVTRVEGGQLVHNNRMKNGPTPREILDIKGILEDLDEMRIDVAALCPPPFLFLYDLPAEEGLRAARIQNDALARLNQEYPDRLANLATVPLQDVDMAVKELERAIRELKLFGVEIGSNVRGVHLGAPQFRPFWQAVADMDVFVFIHPEYFQEHSSPTLNEYYLVNFVGNPVETALNAAHMVFSGLFEELPTLKVMLAHAGGATPWVMGRWDHGYRVRREAKTKLRNPPSESVKKFYFDTVAHDPRALQYLVETFGADHVLLGSDFPFDMALDRPVEAVEALRISEEDKQKILSGNAACLMGLSEGGTS